MFLRNHSCFTPLIAVAGFVLAGSAGAQTCPSPIDLAPNVMTEIDTCQGDSYLPLVCGAIPLTGPALVVRLDLPYPDGRITVQSQNFNFNPAVFLVRSQCRSDAMCDAAEFQGSPAVPNEVELFKIDSGSYFLVVAPVTDDAGEASCGAVNVYWSVEQQDEPLLHDGIFRSGIAPVWEPKP